MSDIRVELEHDTIEQRHVFTISMPDDALINTLGSTGAGRYTGQIERERRAGAKVTLIAALVGMIETHNAQMKGSAT